MNDRQGGIGPVRTKAPRGGAPGARPARRAAPPKPKTAEELDKELDAFMKDEIITPPSTAAPAQGDVEMA